MQILPTDVCREPTHRFVFPFPGLWSRHNILAILKHVWHVHPRDRVRIKNQAGDTTGSRAKSQTKTVPDRLVGELALFVCKSGSNGIEKIATDFTALHPGPSKRQVEKKMQARIVGIKYKSYLMSSSTVKVACRVKSEMFGLSYQARLARDEHPARPPAVVLKIRSWTLASPSFFSARLILD